MTGRNDTLGSPWPPLAVRPWSRVVKQVNIKMAKFLSKREKDILVLETSSTLSQFRRLASELVRGLV
jgi:hypothetical protein